MPPAPPIGRRPRCVLFYRWWCGLFVLIYLGVALEEILVATGRIEPQLGLLETAVGQNDPKTREEIVADKRNDAPGVAAFTALVAGLYGFAALVPRRPWAWTFSLVMICTTILPFFVTVAGAVPLLICWTRPEMQAYFNRR